MLNKKFLSLIAMLLCAGLTLAACGDDDDSTAGNNGNNTADAGPDAVEDADDGDVPGEEDAGPDADASDPGCENNDDCAEGEVCEVASGECVMAPSGCDLTGADRPARCDQGFEEVEWGPTSLVTEFVVAGRVVGEEVDPECCYDYTGDSEIDNALGETLLTIDEATFNSVNTSIAESIADQSLLLMFEHAGLTDLTASEDYQLNFWLGEYNEANELLIDPSSIDEGSYPQAVVENATIQGSSLSAGPGTVSLTVDLLNTPLSLLISQTQIEAEIDMDNSSIADGIIMMTGKLGGVIRLTDIYDGLNGFASGCDCYGLEDGQNLIDYEFDPDQGLLVSCNAGRTEAGVCEDAGESTCATIAENCGVLGSLPVFADVDLDGDGIDDAISIGAKFTTEAAVITGVAPAE